MKDNSGVKTLVQLAALLGASGVGFGALGAHAMQKTLLQRNMLESYKTAVLYQLLHAVSILGVASLEAASSASNRDGSTSPLVRAGKAMALGTTLFSGSIYCLCFGVGPKKVMGPTTPIGGLIMIGGWVMLGLAA